PARRSGRGAVPSAHALWWDQGWPAKYRPVSSDEFAAHRLAPEPLTIFFAARRFRIALSEEFIECVAGPRVRLHDQPAAFDRDRDLHSRPQPHKIEQRGWNG